MRIEVAKHAGICYGVERALKLAREAADGGGSVHTLGPLIHNPQAVESLRALGIEVAGSVDEIADGTVVIRSHGIDPAIIEQAVRRSLYVVDATCPFVSAAQHCAADLLEQGYSVIILGEAAHPEVEGILAYAGGQATIVESADEIPERLPSKRIGLVVQTTQSLQRLQEVVGVLLPRVTELRVCNTICSATAKRQDAAAALAAAVDVVVVVGGRNSGNTRRLAEICTETGTPTYHVETGEELRPEWFAGMEVVGVTAGASTPDEQIADVVEAVRRIGEADGV